MLPSPRASVASAMAPVKRLASKVEHEVDGYRKQRYIGGEFGIPMPGKFAALSGMPEELVIRWQIDLPEKD